MKYLILSLTCFLLLACNESNKDTDTDKQELGNFGKTDNLPTCNCSDLKKDSLSKISYLEDVKFTGICYSYYPNDSTKKMEEIQFLEGKIHGFYRIYSPTDNTVLTEDIYKNGKKSGSAKRFKCDCNELTTETIGAEKLRVYKLEGEKFTGICEKFTDDRKFKILDMEFLDGLRHGNSIYYDQYGKPITSDIHANGKFIKTIVYTDSEEEE